MKYNCDVITDLIPLCKDGAASQASAQLVQKHLVECEECLRNYQEADNHKLEASAAAMEEAEVLYDYARKIRRYRFHKRLFLAILAFLFVLSLIGYRYYTSLRLMKGDDVKLVSIQDKNDTMKELYVEVERDAFVRMVVDRNTQIGTIEIFNYHPNTNYLDPAIENQVTMQIMLTDHNSITWDMYTEDIREIYFKTQEKTSLLWQNEMLMESSSLSNEY